MRLEFGYRFLVAEAGDAGQPMAERTAWRICSTNGWWSASGRKRGKNGKAGPPVHDDLVGRDFTADAPNQLWLSDITEHRTSEGKLYLCAIKDVFSNRIVGYTPKPWPVRCHDATISPARRWDTREQLRIAIVTWIERTYHRRRRQALSAA
jgi:transposase InsO family protein